MSIPTHIRDYFDEYDHEEKEIDRVSHTHCKYCGKDNLQWEDDNGKWVLISNKSGEVHKCVGKRTLNPDLDKLMNEKI
jgi:hypothetical protein